MSDEARRLQFAWPGHPDPSTLAPGPLDDDAAEAVEEVLLAEHPGLEEALDDEREDGPVRLADGGVIEPMTHLMQHHLAVAALWADAPSEVWPTAKRLLALGYERHEVHHMLGFVLIDRFLDGFTAALELEELEHAAPTPIRPDILPDVATALAALPESWEAHLAEEDADDDRRRDFAVPPAGSLTYGDEDLEFLDRDDEDDRGLFIRAEHPEFWDALDAGSDLIGPDGEPLNPHLHVAMHAVVANQLMADDPPETWDTAQRLLDLGYERHDVLHMIANAVSDQMVRALRDGVAPDPDEYFEMLDALPESWEALVTPEEPREPRSLGQADRSTPKKPSRKRKGNSGQPRGRKRRKK